MPAISDTGSDREVVVGMSGLGLKDKWELFKLYRRRSVVLEKLKSRKLWAAVIGGALTVLLTQLGVAEETVHHLVQIVAVYISGQAAVDLAAALKGNK